MKKLIIVLAFSFIIFSPAGILAKQNYNYCIHVPLSSFGISTVSSKIAINKAKQNQRSECTATFMKIPNKYIKVNI